MSICKTALPIDGIVLHWRLTVITYNVTSQIYVDSIRNENNFVNTQNIFDSLMWLIDPFKMYSLMYTDIGFGNNLLTEEAGL